MPDTPDHTDAIARVRAIGVEHRPASVSVVRASLTCVCGHESTNDDGLEEHRAELIVEALLDFATLAERHPDALLTALTNAGVLRREQCEMFDGHGGMVTDGDSVTHIYRRPTIQNRRVTEWVSEVQQP